MKVAEKYTDSELIDAITSGNELNEPIMNIYQRFAATTSSFIRSLGASEQDAEDVFQETVIAFIDIVKRGKYRKEASIKTFLTSVARNIWLNEMKKRQQSDKRDKKFEIGRGQEEEDISEQIGDLEKKKQLRELLNKLGEPCRKILILFYYENLSMKEMLTHLPYENEQVVRNKKYKCLQQLTGMIKDNPAVLRQINEIIK